MWNDYYLYSSILCTLCWELKQKRAQRFSCNCRLDAPNKYLLSCTPPQGVLLCSVSSRRCVLVIWEGASRHMFFSETGSACRSCATRRRQSCRQQATLPPWCDTTDNHAQSCCIAGHSWHWHWHWQDLIPTWEDASRNVTQFCCVIIFDGEYQCS